MAAPTGKEISLIVEFRRRVIDVLETEEQKSDAYLLRWIRARENDLNKADDMLRNDVKWRKEFRTENLLFETHDQFFYDNFPFRIASTSKEGCPVFEFPFGIWDLRKILTYPNGEEGFARYTTTILELLVEKIKKNNAERGLKEGDWPITQIVVIVDFSGFSYGQLLKWKATQNIVKFVSCFEAHYPEVLKRCFALNCASFISLWWALIKPFLAPKTIAKASFHGTKKDDWVQEVHNLVPKEDLGPQFGGTKNELKNILLKKNKTC